MRCRENNSAFRSSFFNCIAEQGNPTSVEHRPASLLTRPTHATQRAEPARNEKQSNGGLSGTVSNNLLGFDFGFDFFDDTSDTSYHLT
jgi:hypothetical protein